MWTFQGKQFLKQQKFGNFLKSYLELAFPIALLSKNASSKILPYNVEDTRKYIIKLPFSTSLFHYKSFPPSFVFFTFPSLRLGFYM
jgi:hypothetical protein